MTKAYENMVSQSSEYGIIAVDWRVGVIWRNENSEYNQLFQEVCCYDKEDKVVAGETLPPL